MRMLDDKSRADSVHWSICFTTVIYVVLCEIKIIYTLSTSLLLHTIFIPHMLSIYVNTFIGIGDVNHTEDYQGS